MGKYYLAIDIGASSGRHIIAEIVDDQGNPVPKGVEGELVITTIGMEAMPLIRYRTGDYTRILPGKCACGSETIRLDLLRRKGNPGKILTLDEQIFAVPSIVDYMAVMSNETLALKVLATDSMDPEHLTQLFPNAAIDIQFVTKEDGPLYLGKRILCS